MSMLDTWKRWLYEKLSDRSFSPRGLRQLFTNTKTSSARWQTASEATRAGMHGGRIERRATREMDWYPGGDNAEVDRDNMAGLTKYEIRDRGYYG
ncbi:MAG: hypothetical protein M1813_000596 [Trichoglossum hirsutum]|nr:MAG: hypothetical protein M1813_000596 [Trichoglossum hirsutum]